MHNKDAILAAISAEMNRQDDIWGSQREQADTVWNTILSEEVGEAAKAVLENDHDNLCEELIQIAAVAAQWAMAVGCRS